MSKPISINVPSELIEKEVLLRVCLLFLEKVFLFIDHVNDQWIIQFKSIASSKTPNLDTIVGEFKNMLISEELREYLSADTRIVKQMIVTKALYGAGHDDQFSGNITQADSLLGINYSKKNNNLIDEDFFEDEDNYLEDPLGIAVSWTEKTGKEKKVKKIN